MRRNNNEPERPRYVDKFIKGIGGTVVFAVNCVDVIVHLPLLAVVHSVRLGAAGLRAAEDLIVGDNAVDAVPAVAYPVDREDPLNEEMKIHNDAAELAIQLAGDMP